MVTKTLKNTQNLVTHIIKNGQVYYFCKRVNGKILKYSLQTKELQIAIQRKNLLLKMNLPDLKSLNRRTLTIMFNNNSITIEKSNQNESDELVLNALKIALNQKNNQIHTQGTKIDLKVLFEEFIKNKQKVGKVSESSIKKYNTTFKLFTQKYNEITDIKEFKPKDFDEFQEELIEKGLNSKTINNHMTYVKMFFDYAVKKDYIDKNPMKSDFLQEQKSTKENFTDAEIAELITNQEIPKEYQELNQFSAYSGMRISEILNLKQEDIKDNLINIKDGKTENATRTIPLHSKIDNLKELKFLEQIYKNCRAEDKIKQITKTANRYINKIIPSPNKTFHCLRATFIEKLYTKQNYNENVIKYLVGHTQNKNITFTTYAKSKLPLAALKEHIEYIKY